MMLSIGQIPTRKYFPLILSVVLYLLLYFLRFQQGGWEIESNLFEAEREILSQKINTLLNSPNAELLSGILLGKKEELPGQLRLALRDTSTIHIVVVSGQNLTLLAGLIMNLSGLLTRRVAIAFAFLAVLGYLLLSGVQIPALRAAIMVGLAYTGQALGRQSDGLWGLILAAGSLLLINPGWVSDLSFILSFLATFGVVIVAPILAKRLKSLPLFLRENLALTLGAQLMVTPVIAQNFHQFSLVSIPANLLILWTIPYIMVGGAFMVLLGSLWQFLGEIIALIVGALLTYFIYIVQFFASLPFAWEYVGEQVWIVWVGYYLILAAVVLLLNNGQRENLTRS